MSITNDFEKKCFYVHDHGMAKLNYTHEDVIQLLAHARALEAMLKEHQFCQWSSDPGDECPECGNPERYGHTQDCQLAKLLDGVE